MQFLIIKYHLLFSSTLNKLEQLFGVTGSQTKSWDESFNLQCIFTSNVLRLSLADFKGYSRYQYFHYATQCWI